MKSMLCRGTHIWVEEVKLYMEGGFEYEPAMDTQAGREVNQKSGHAAKVKVWGVQRDGPEGKCVCFSAEDPGLAASTHNHL